MTTYNEWKALAYEMASEYGAHYEPEDLANPNWCSRELARLGYSVSFTFLTLDYARQLNAGLEPHDPKAFEGVPITYQLWGPMYPERGRHSSPLCETLEQAAAIALYNVVKLNYEKAEREKEGGE